MKYQLFLYHLPFIKPVNFNGHILTERSGLIIEHQDNKQGCLHYAEIAPLPGFSRESMTQVIEQTIAFLNNKLQNENQLYPSLQFALDCLATKQTADKTELKIDSIPLLLGNNENLLKQYQKLNQPPKIKLKAGRQTVMQDIDLFNQLWQLNPQLSIRCDANQTWNKSQAEQFFKGINKLQLDYIEEPTADHDHNLQLASEHNIYLGLDETLQNSEFNYQAHPYIKALVLKPMLIGSRARLDAFINVAKKDKLQVSISSSFESVIGLQQLEKLANSYSGKCQLSLGIDTLKYFQQGLLTDKNSIHKDIKKLECLWTNH